MIKILLVGVKRKQIPLISVDFPSVEFSGFDCSEKKSPRVTKQSLVIINSRFVSHSLDAYIATVVGRQRMFRCFGGIGAVKRTVAKLLRKVHE